MQVNNLNNCKFQILKKSCPVGMRIQNTNFRKAVTNWNLPEKKMLVLQVTTASNNRGVGLDVTILQQKHLNSFSCCYALQMIWREMFCCCLYQVKRRQLQLLLLQSLQVWMQAPHSKVTSTVSTDFLASHLTPHFCFQMLNVQQLGSCSRALTHH